MIGVYYFIALFLKEGLGPLFSPKIKKKKKRRPKTSAARAPHASLRSC